ncbi:MAG: hypothetical protein AAF826_12365 [Pseudomonadota bacterium]
MTRFLISILAIFLILPLAARAQTVEVRSGEHADFTRLVFNLPERLNVELMYQAQGVMLSFERDGLTFDTNTVFERVPTTRLTAIGAAASTITLTLACKCDVNTFWASDRAFVIDIGDETAISAALFPSTAEEQQLSPETNEPIAETVETAMENPQSDSPAQDAISLTKGPTRPGKAGVGSVAFLIADAQDRLDQMSLASSVSVPTYALRLRRSQDAIVKQLGRAATQGLLSPREDLMPSVPQTVTDAAPMDPPPTETVRSVSLDDPGLGQNITLNAQTSVDQALSRRINLGLDRTQSDGCLDRARVDVQTWAREGNFVDQIGSLRSKIIGEFDEPSYADILTLVRFYIHFGFGAEAHQVANMLPGKRPIAPELRAMIRILDQGHDDPNSIFAGQMDCPPIVAVWSLLSYETVPGNQPIDPDAIVRGILGLPTHLRAYLGPMVGKKLQRAGYVRAADHVARALIRNADTKTAAARYLHAESGSRSSDADLGGVVADNAEPAPSALLTLIEKRLETGQSISKEMAILAGAYAMEKRHTPIGLDLSRAYLLSLASSGNYSDSFTEFNRLKEAGPAPTSNTLSEMFALLTKRAPNPAFLAQALVADPATRFSLDDEVGNGVAKRLITLGFPKVADRFVASMAKGDAERARKLLRAEIALQENLPRKAELELIGEEGKNVMQLLARARGMAGEHGSSQQIYAEIDEDGAALRQAWLDGDWQVLQGHSDPAIAAVANRQVAPVAASEADATQVLARNNEILKDSQSMRAEIEALLSGITVPAPLDDRVQ